MHVISGLALAIGIGAVTGLGLTAITTSSGTGAAAVRIGPWVGVPRAGTTEADPYARAIQARYGTLPLALSDGLTLIAETDREGRPLDAGCTVRVVGNLPPARFWTLSLVDEARRPAVPIEERRGFTSLEMVRQGDQAVDIVVAARARPGHWLPTGTATRYALVLRLYDSAAVLSLSAGAVMPTITREACP